METITYRAAAALRNLRAASGSARPADPGGDPVHDRVLEQLTAEARYHRQRYDLYRAKMYALRPSTQRRLRELQRASEAAERRLAAATKATRGPDSTEPPRVGA